jgi:anthranilate phosphoribosyltransferase
VLVRLGALRAMVAAGRDASSGAICDISVTGPTHLVRFDSPAGEADINLITRSEVTPEQLGLPRHGSSAALVIRTPEESAARIRGILRGAEQGPARDIVLANAAAALWVGGAVEDLPTGVKKAAGVIDSGAAVATLEALVRLSHEPA